MSKELFIIFDGNSFVHRAYHALPAFSNKQGFPTQVITGVSNMINRVITELKPSVSVVAFDAKGKNFRHEICPDYKHSRESMPEEMRIQLEPLKLILKNWGFPLIEVEGVEADDSMSSLALKAASEGFQVIMVTSDKDMSQIVNEDISILDTKSAESKGKMLTLDVEGVKTKMGVYPKNIIDFLALVGDKADDVKGVDKCGEKTAVKWIEQYGSMDNLIKEKDSVKGKVGENLREAIENGTLETAKKLVTIKKDVFFDKNPSEMKNEMNKEELLKLFNIYELRTLKKSLGLIDDKAEKASLGFVNDSFSFSVIVESIISKANNNKDKKIPFIFETLKDGDKEYPVIKMIGDDNQVAVGDFEKNSICLLELLNIDNIILVAFETKTVLKDLERNLKIKNIFQKETEDLLVYDYLAEGGRSKLMTIESLNDFYTNFNLSTLREEYKIGTKTSKIDKLGLEQKILLKTEEIKICESILKNKKELLEDLVKMDNKTKSILAKMEKDGCLVDAEYLLELGLFFKDKINNLEVSIYKEAGREFKIGSPKEVANILYNVLGIESKKKTTAEDVLSPLKEKNPIVGMILEWRSLSKLKSTYVDGIISRLDDNNVVHTTYNSTLTTTGRLSSTDPNLQNIPVRTEDGKKIRKAFVAREGYKIVKADYSQIELRILAHFSKDKKLQEAYQKNEDIHKLTASIIFGKDLNEITEDERRFGKTINFGLIYGISERRLAVDLGIEKKEASKFYKNYFVFYSSVKPYFENELALSKENLYVETFNNRKLYNRDLNSTNPHVRSHAERSANNSRLQGTAADIIKLAMINCFNFIENSELDARILMQVHDELVFEVKEDLVDSFSETIKVLMESVVKLEVPLVVDVKIKDHL